MRKRLDTLLEPYDPRNPPSEGWGAIAAIPATLALLLVLFIVWKPIFTVLRWLILG